MDATLAQLVEQLICNHQVVGSIPTGGSTLSRSDAVKTFGAFLCPPRTDDLMIQSVFGGRLRRHSATLRGTIPTGGSISLHPLKQWFRGFFVDKCWLT